MTENVKSNLSEYLLVSAEQSPQGLYFVNKNRKIVFWNRKAEEITGFASSEVVGKRCQDNILEHTDKSGKKLCNDACPLVVAIESRKPQFKKVFLKSKIGSRIPVTVEVYPVLDSHGNSIGAVEFFSESYGLKEIKERIRELERKAYLDPLTQIPNRRLFELTLSRRLRHFKETGAPFGLIFLDLNNFKEINDRFGHMHGDMALKSVSQTIISNIKPSDLAARYGGDEFVILLDGVTKGDLMKFAKKMDILIRQSSFKFRGKDIPLSASFGGTVAMTGDSKRSLLKRADSLMLKAKSTKGRNILIGP